MFSELFNGKIVYSKRFPLSEEIDELAEAVVNKRKTFDASPAAASFTEYMQQNDEKCVYVLRPDKVDFCQQFIDRAKSFSELYEIGIDIISYQFSYVAKLYIGLALFQGTYKEKMIELLSGADEISIDRTNEEDCEIAISLRCHTHDLYYSGKRKVLH